MSMHPLPPSPSFDQDPDDNPSRNRHLLQVAAPMLTRRAALRGAGAAAGLLLGAPLLTACGGSDAAEEPLRLGFTAVAKNKLDVVTVPGGYRVAVLHALGDPLTTSDAAWADNGSESAESYDRRIGCGHDGMHYFGLGSNGRWEPTQSGRGLLCVNHEYVVAPYALHPAGMTAGARRVPAEVDKEVRAHGVSVAEVQRTGSELAHAMVRGSRFNRRITSDTPMAFTGPARGSARLVTKGSPDGTTTRGTNNNCANGHTPWGTYLTCEENFTNVISRAAGDDARRSAPEIAALRRYGMAQGRRSPYAWDTAGAGYERWSASVTAGDGSSAADDWRNAFNTFGWVVEIDPFAPDSTPVKRTALGRFAHEGAWPAAAVAGQPIVYYMGDDSRNEYIYKFVSKALWDPADATRGLAAGAKYLDEGTLYVARFNADGSGQWIELTHGKGGLDAANPLYPFASQADVVTYARLAADHVGATKMDRPEWGAVNPRNGEVYMTLTNNSNRVEPSATPTGSQLKPDAANPRAYADTFTNADGSTRTNKGNVNGHIVRWREGAAVTAFTWDIYLFGAQADAPADVNLSGLGADNDFSSPDGLGFDPRGLLWIQTDDGAYTDVTNCMLLAAVPGQVGDGGTATAVGGTTTRKGANATAATLRRFLVGPKDCEITGLAFTPDAKTLFVNVQHPGEDGTLAAPTSAWPASQTQPNARTRPRSATVVVTRSDGAAVGN